jgi:cob(I)alamin adenosyltransferase
MSQFYTRKGDDGFTGLLGAGRVPKYHPQTEAVGVVDEATAALGLARAACQAEGAEALLLSVQRDLYNLMAEVSATPENAARFRKIDARRVAWIESEVDAISQGIEMPSEFIVPGDSQAGACLALARTIVRRAERRVVELVHSGDIENAELIKYLNRLSSLCFVLELQENQAAGRVKTTLAKG